MAVFAGLPNIAVVCLWVASNKTNPKFFTTRPRPTRKIPTEPEQFVAFGVVVAGVTAVVVAVLLLAAVVVL